MMVQHRIERYGDTGFGDKPPNMCRVEYWLAHLDPEAVTALGTTVW